MRDRRDSTPNPESLDETAGFRETFLHRFTERKDREALERFAALLFAYWGEFQGHMPDQQESVLRAEFRAALADLEYLAIFLREVVGFAPEAASIDPEDLPLATKALEVADKLGDCATGLADMLRRHKNNPV
ncbi:MAG: hypothetical protein SX243_06560 [Acidobacteriota bacterium]|nr:hypothetical protein [Acidobacteriota bacterium]